MDIRKWLALSAALIFFGLWAAVAQAADAVPFAFDWIFNGTQAGFFAASDKGYYRDAGMNVALSRGFGSGDTVKRVATGGLMFGLADTSTVVAARANEDVPVRIVAVLYGKAPLGVIYLAESGIKKPKDLEGRTIARAASGSSVTMFPGFLKANSIDRSKIKELVADANTLLPLMISRRVDAVLGQTANMGRYIKMAQEEGLHAEKMNYADFGLVAYGNAIIANTQVLEKRPDLVRRFVEVSLKGNAYALAHPDEAIASMKKIQPEVDAPVAREELVEVYNLIMTNEVKKNGIGFASQAGMAATIQTVHDALALKRTLAVDEVFDLRFLPKTPVLPK